MVCNQNCAEMESWLRIGECREVPSAFTLQCSSYSTPITVVANGSNFLHIVDSIKKQQLVSRRHLESTPMRPTLHSLASSSSVSSAEA